MLVFKKRIVFQGVLELILMKSWTWWKIYIVYASINLSIIQTLLAGTLIPNTELLLKSYDSEFLSSILESNKRRKEEIRDEDVWREIEKTKRGVRALERELMAGYGEGL